MSDLLWRLGNWCFRAYICRAGRDAPARTLIATLEWLRWYAADNRLDFPAAVLSSRRRGSADFDEPLVGDTVRRLLEEVVPHD